MCWCEDGSPFPVVFRSEEDAAKRWRVEQEHSIGPNPPLADALSRLGYAGGGRAYEEVGLGFPASWVEGPYANGFPYFADGEIPPEEMGAMFAAGAGNLGQYSQCSYRLALLDRPAVDHAPLC